MTVAPSTAVLRWLAFTAVILGLVLPAPGASAVTQGWTHQFGTTNVDEALAVALDRSGNSYVTGWTQGALPGQASSGSLDVFVRKYDPAGTELWTRQFGGGGGDGGAGVALDAAGNPYVAGTTRGAMPGQVTGGDYDAFVRRYDPEGNEVWTRQFGGNEGEGARSVAIGSGGKVLIVGSTQGSFPEHSNSGGFDVFVSQYDLDGNALWLRQFGSDVNDFGVAVATDDSGQVTVVGSTDGVLLAKSTGGGTDSFIRRYDSTGTAMWTEQFGGAYTDAALAVAMDAAGRAFVVGSATRSAPGRPGSGQDAYISCYDSIGRQLWVSEFGTESVDIALGVALFGHAIHVVGGTLGALPGQTSTGSRDAYTLTFG